MHRHDNTCRHTSRCPVVDPDDRTMKIPPWLATIIVSAMFAMQAWTLTEIVNLKVSVANLETRINLIHQ